MITSIANNIGIEQVSFKDYQTEKLTVLNGTFTVDSSSAAWKAATEIEFEFTSLVMQRSADTAVYMVDSVPKSQFDNAKRGTIAKSWIRDNRLHIEKIDYFDDYGPITFVIASAYASCGQRNKVVREGYVNSGIENNPANCETNNWDVIVKEHYVYCMMIFDKFYGVDDGLNQAFDIIGMPSDVNVDIPVVYANNTSNTDGAAMTIARLQNRHFTCTNPNYSMHYANKGTFIHFFAVRDGASVNNNQ